MPVWRSRSRKRAWHAGDLEAAGLAAVDAAAQVLEGGAEEALDVVGLEALGVRPLHLLADRLDLGEGQGLLGQRAALEEVEEVGVAGGVVDDLEEARLDLGLLAVADRLDQEVAERLLLEQLAEHIVDPAAECRARRFELFEQAGVDGALAGLVRDQVPEMADLGLADPVDAAEALLEAVGVPGQVVVDHQVGALEVDAFAGGVVRDHDQDCRVVQEGVDGGAARLAGEPAVDLDHGFGAAEAGADLVGEVGERVARLGEDDELAAVAGGIGHQWLVEDALQLAPFGVGARAAERLGLLLEATERSDLKLELRDRLGGRGAVDQSLLDRLDLVLRLLVEVLEELGAVGSELAGSSETGIAAALQEARFLDAPLELLAAAAERFVDRGRRGGEPALQDLEREADVLAALIALGEPLGAVHLLAHVFGDRVVERRLVGRQTVVHGIGAALRKQGPAVEGLELLLGQAAQHVADVGGVHAFAEAALEAVAVEQRHEQLEVGFLAAVRGRGHQEEMPGASGETLAELVTPGILDLTAEVGGRQAVRLVADHEVPLAGGEELGLEVLVAAQHVEARDPEVGLIEGVADAARLDPVAGEDREVEVELLRQLVLPLLDQVAGRGHEAALEVAADQQLLDQQGRHDGLAGAGIVGEQEAQGLARQHLAVDRGDLVGQRLDQGGGERQVRIEKIGQPDALSLGRQPKQVAVAAERPDPTRSDPFQGGLVGPIDQAVTDCAVPFLERDLDRLIAEPLDLNDPRRGAGDEAANERSGLQILKAHHGQISMESNTYAQPSVVV